MVKVITTSGFEFEANEHVVNDWRFAKALAGAQGSDPVRQIDSFSELIALIFGKQEEAYYKHLAEKYDGIVPTDVLGKELGYIVRELQATSETAKK